MLDARAATTAPSFPRPLAGPLAWLGDRIQPADRLDQRPRRDVPGGPLVLWMLLAARASCWPPARSPARRSGAARWRSSAPRTAALPATDDPQALEREAERAERDGDWERAVRLRFRAGLLRLDRRQVLVYRPSLTTGEVARAVESPAFREVGDRFDEIAYGGRPAEREDAEAARRGWAEVLEAAREAAAPQPRGPARVRRRRRHRRPST